ncbi:MAG: hypothetical protein MUF54_16460 [Polyangiaceae bacterium]|nr:hypothetical protein [Polyangiaceae bacterium]
MPEVLVRRPELVGQRLDACDGQGEVRLVRLRSRSNGRSFDINKALV